LTLVSTVNVDGTPYCFPREILTNKRHGHAFTADLIDAILAVANAQFVALSLAFLGRGMFRYFLIVSIITNTQEMMPIEALLYLYGRFGSFM